MLIIKGFMIGFAKIIPGVSGAVIAMSIGVYKKAIFCISNFFKSPFENIKFLLPLMIGIFLSVIIGSKAVLFLLNNFYLPTMLLFIGLIIGGTINTYNKVKINNINKFQYLIMIVCFIFVFALSFVGHQNFFIISENKLFHFLLFGFIGFIDAVTMVIPGISGTAVMMLLGLYDLLLGLLSSLNSISNIILNLNSLIPYILGLFITVIILSRIMNYLLQKKETTTYCGIIGFSLSSILLLFLETFNGNYNIFEIIISLFFLVLGFFISKKLEH